ncbi:MAG TPA: WG repeat-containing protein [Flavisolibacter sp.]|nr:WG repeat-containing protein [Flavisolibacter sp.]
MSCTVLYGQKKFKVVEKETDTWRSIYSLIDEQGKVIRELDTAKYYMCFNTDQYVYFGIFGVKGRSGWTAIDADENILFKIYNTSFGEPSPDYLVENKIRIVDEQEKIGFANNKGEIIIRPQYEMATAFHKGKAIIGEKCRKVPWGEHEKESGCHHYSIECGKYGYINEKGKELKMGTFSFEQIMKEINWKMPED